MNRLRQIAAWSWRAWPAIALAVAVALHVVALTLFAAHSTLVNKLTGTVLQVVGGLLVLHSIDGNLGLFRNQGLVSAFMLWLGEFPTGRTRTVQLGGVGAVGEIGVAGALSIGTSRPLTLEERIGQLEAQLGEERRRLRDLEESVAKRLASLKDDLRASIGSVDASVRELTVKVERTAVGGVKQQLLGVLLAIYGAGVSVFA